MSEHSPRGFTQTETGLYIPEARLGDEASIVKRVSTTPSGIEMTDTRRVTPESVEADFQKSKEALRAPLTPEEAIAVLGRVQAQATERMQSQDSAPEDTGDVVAANTLSELLAGKRQLDQKPGESTDDFLSRMSERFKPVGYQEGDELAYKGYDGSLFYRYKRAQQLLDSLREHPDKARVEYLGAEQLGAYMSDEETAEEVSDEIQDSHEAPVTPTLQESRLHSYFGAVKERKGERIHLDDYEPHTVDDELPPTEAEALDSLLRDAESVGMSNPNDLAGLAEYANMEANSEDPLARLRVEYAAKAMKSDLSLQEMDSFLTHVGDDVFMDATNESLSDEDRWLNHSIALLHDYVRQAVESGKDLKAFVKALDEKAMTDGGANMAAGALEALINKNPLAVRNLIDRAEKVSQHSSV